MTVETKLALTEQDVRSFSAKMNEAELDGGFPCRCISESGTASNAKTR